MCSPVVWFRNWFNAALYEGDGWPKDPLNRGITPFFLTYIGVPGFFVILMLSATTDAGQSFPIWLSPFPILVLYIVPWIALDEWRSRKRNEERSRHSWIVQVLKEFWPKRQINRIALSIVSAAFVVGALIAYADRITEADLQQERLVVVVQTTLVIMLDLWVVAVAIRLGYTIRSCFAFGAQYCESWLESPS